MAVGHKFFGQQFTDGGDVAADGTVSFFLAGTSTPTPVYSDLAITSSLGTSVDLDAAGRYSVYLNPSLAYKVKWFDSAGALIDEQDDLRVAPPASAEVDFPEWMKILTW